MPENGTLSAEELAELLLPVAAEEFLVGSNDRPDRVVRNNHVFNAVIRQKSTVCSLLATIRWKLLHLGRKQYANATGIDRNTIKAVEKKDHEHTLHWRYTTVHNLIKHWEKHPDIVTPAHIQAVIDGILAERKGTIEGLFFESEYRFGQGTMERDGGITPDAVRAYRGTTYIPPYKHLESIATHATNRGEHIDLERLQRVWADGARQILCSTRDVPPSLAELHVQAEIQGSDVLSSARRILRNTTPSAATKIGRFAMPPWKEADPIARDLIDGEAIGDFEQQWRQEYDEEYARPDFHSRLREIQFERRFSDHKIKRILGVEGKRPFILMRDPVIEGRSDANTDAPPAVLARIIGRTPKETTTLINLFRENRSLWRKRMGYPTFDDPVRLDREQWGITNGELSTILSAKNRHDDSEVWGDALPAVLALRAERKKWPQRVLMLCENGQGTLAVDAQSDAHEKALRRHLRSIIAHLGRQRANAAIERRDRAAHPQSITEAVTCMAEEAADGRTSQQHREFLQLARAAKDLPPESDDQSVPAYCSVHHIRRYADGIEVPSLPVLNHMLDAGSIEDAQTRKTLQTDWAERFALQLQGKIVIPRKTRKQYPSLHPIPQWILHPEKHAPLSAALLHCIGRVGTSMCRFARDRMPSASAADRLTQAIKTINTSGGCLDEKLPSTLSEILLAADISKGTPQWVWTHMLLGNRGRTLPSYRAWRKRLPSAAATPWNLPGLTSDDIRKLEEKL